MRSSIIELKTAVNLLHDFFYYQLFDFDIKEVVNAVPINREGINKVYSGSLKLGQRAADQLKIIYYARNKAKSSWLHMNSEMTQGIFKQVANTLKALNRGDPETCLRESFLPVSLCGRMTEYIVRKAKLTKEARRNKEANVRIESWETN